LAAGTVVADVVSWCVPVSLLSPDVSAVVVLPSEDSDAFGAESSRTAPTRK